MSFSFKSINCTGIRHSANQRWTVFTSKFFNGSKYLNHRLIITEILLSPKGNIQNHHKGKTYHKHEGSNVGVFPFRHFRNEFFDYNVYHGSGGKS